MTQKLPTAKIKIGDENSEEMLAKYDKISHFINFPPKDPKLVTEISGDRNEKVLVKPCKDNARTKQSGQASRRKSCTKTYLNGWWMLTNPKSGCILAFLLMHKPENNDVKIKSLENIFGIYTQCDLFIHDVNCKFGTFAVQSGKCSQIKYSAVDKFHAKKHGRSKRNYLPYNNPILMKRSEGIKLVSPSRRFLGFDRTVGRLTR